METAGKWKKIKAQREHSVFNILIIFNKELTQLHS